MKQIVSGAILLMTLYGCRTVYAPNTVNTPLFQEGRQLKVLAAPNNVQAAYAVSDHIGVMGNGYFNRFSSDDNDFHNKGFGAEAAVGYFAAPGNGLAYEMYGGAGLLKVTIDESSKQKTFAVSGTKLFVQPGIGWVNPYVEVGVSPRLSMISYAAPDIKGYTAQEQSDHLYTGLSDSPFLFFEPALTVRGGYKWIKLQVQVGKVIKLSGQEINFDDNLGSIGLIFDVGKWYR